MQVYPIKWPVIWQSLPNGGYVIICQAHCNTHKNTPVQHHIRWCSRPPGMLMAQNLAPGKMYLITSAMAPRKESRFIQQKKKKKEFNLDQAQCSGNCKCNDMIEEVLFSLTTCINWWILKLAALLKPQSITTVCVRENDAHLHFSPFTPIMQFFINSIV